MLQHIIGSILEAGGDIEIAGSVARIADLPHATRRLRPDIVILGLDSAELPELTRELYTADPWVQLLGVVGDGRQAYLYEMRPHRTALGELSPTGLITAVRRMATARSSGSLGIADQAPDLPERSMDHAPHRVD